MIKSNQQQAPCPEEQGEKNVITSLRKFIAYKHKNQNMKKTIFKLVVQTRLLKFRVLIAIYSLLLSLLRLLADLLVCIFGESDIRILR